MHSLCVRSVVLEVDPQVVASRVTMRGAEGEPQLTEQVGRRSCCACLSLCACYHRVHGLASPLQVHFAHHDSKQQGASWWRAGIPVAGRGDPG